jgi:hypothetical protein
MKAEQKVCIIGGFTEGDHHAHHFVQVLERQGFSITKRLQDADIIVTHSGGCFLLPENLAGKTVIIVSPPCDYHDSLFKNTLRKIGLDYHAHRDLKRLKHFVHKTSWSGLYFFTHGKQHWQMLHQMPKSGTNLPHIKAQKTMVITTKDDPWSSHISPTTITKNPSYIFLNLAATHDDIWMHPERYVAIIQSI